MSTTATVSDKVPVWISDTVLVELVWTLSRAHGRDRPDIVTALRALSLHASVAMESADAVRDATDLFAAGPADFADCLLAAKARAAGCNQLPTFDRGMKGLSGVKSM